MALVVGAVILLCLTIPAIAIPRVASPVHQVTPRANYIGGWPLGLAGTGAACPGYASQTCDAGAYSSLNTQCCPTGQSCIASLISAYCCPTSRSRLLGFKSSAIDSSSCGLQHSCNKLPSLCEFLMDHVFLKHNWILLL